MYRITLTLTSREKEALFSLAESERRDPRVQAVLLIHQDLEKLNFLLPEPHVIRQVGIGLLRSEEIQLPEPVTLKPRLVSVSINLMVKVFGEKETTASERLFLLAVADCANDVGECFPSFKTLAEKCNISRRYAIELMKSLENRGYIKTLHRVNDDGKYTSNLYRILPGNFIVNKPSPDDEPGITNPVNKPSPDDEPGITGVVNPTSLKSSINPQLTTKDPAQAPTTEPDPWFSRVASVTGLLPTSNDIKLLIEWESAGVTEEDIRDALQWRKENGKPPVKTIGYLAGGVNVARLKRLQGTNAKGNHEKKPEKKYDYATLLDVAQEAGL